MVIALTYLLALAIVVGATVQGHGQAKGWFPVAAVLVVIVSGAALAVSRLA